jgi:hypothetical protein
VKVTYTITAGKSRRTGPEIPVKFPPEPVSHVIERVDSLIASEGTAALMTFRTGWAAFFPHREQRICDAGGAQGYANPLGA